MLKMYHKQTHAGNTPDFWEENWEGNNFERSVQFCVIDPLRPLFEKYASSGSLMLEGGCGIGHYLAFYASRGWRVVGLDFAQETLRKLHIRQKKLPLCNGDVSRLPFADETFDIYYSGGVVEHFEGGVEASLLEARRVLKKNGVLLISVPYLSPLRTLLSPIKRDIWQKVEQASVDEDKGLDGKSFFQYAYRQKEFIKMLNKAGLEVIETQGYAVLWGLYDIPFLSSSKEYPAKDGSKKRKELVSVNIEPLVKEQPISYLKRLVVSEDAGTPITGNFVRLMRWFSANMMMYVCVPD